MEYIDLERFLRQKPPFRFVDEVRFSQDEGVIESSRLYVPEESFFEGHFPGEPIVPGVILVESMAQSCRAWLNSQVGMKARGFIASIERAKFLKPVRPGDRVLMKAWPAALPAESGEGGARFCRFSCVSRCGEQDVAKANLVLHQVLGQPEDP